MVKRKERPAVTSAGATAAAARRARLAAALRENLRKRKGQKQGRDRAAMSLEPGEAEDAARQPLEGKPQVT